MHLLLHRAIKNAGDFLIHERAVRLIESFRPDVTLYSAPGWRPLHDQFSALQLAEFESIIICGGPGYQNHLESRIYALQQAPATVPVVLLALGTYLFPGVPSQVASYRFHEQTLRLLAQAGTAPRYLGARDVLTERFLRARGLQRVLMTGDPAWYDLETLHRRMPRMSDVGSIAFTPPASPLFDLQAGQLLRALARRYSHAKGVVVFHRGVQPHYAAVAAELGWACRDIQGSSNGFAIYDQTDVHVGYRLHAHLYCLSHARPSFLVAEDSRSRGALETLGMLGVDPLAAHATSWRAMRALRSAVERAPVPRRVSDLARAAVLADISDEITSQIEVGVADGFQGHERARDVIRATMPTMREMVEAIP